MGSASGAQAPILPEILSASSRATRGYCAEVDMRHVGEMPGYCAALRLLAKRDCLTAPRYAKLFQEAAGAKSGARAIETEAEDAERKDKRSQNDDNGGSLDDCVDEQKQT